LAVQSWPAYETLFAAEYAVAGLHAGLQPPPPVGGALVPAEALAPDGDGLTGGAAPANAASNLVKSQLFCGTLEQLPDRAALPSGGVHWRSRLTDQNE
jgi:hypothetical protein